MKLKKLIKLYNGDFIQLNEPSSDITTRVINKYELKHDYGDNLKRKVLSFAITDKIVAGKPVLWVELL